MHPVTAKAGWIDDVDPAGSSSIGLVKRVAITICKRESGGKNWNRIKIACERLSKHTMCKWDNSQV